jgi:hypothetical protein
MSTRINKKFVKAINPRIDVRRRGRHIEVAEPVKNGLRYRVEARGANADTAMLLNSKMPGMTLVPPINQSNL